MEFYILLVWFISCFILLCLLVFSPQTKKRKKAYKNACNCSDVNQCEKWCIGKINYSKNHNYSIKEICKHPNKITLVLEVSVTCEKTVEVCADCDQWLSTPKTDCA